MLLLPVSLIPSAAQAVTVFITAGCQDEERTVPLGGVIARIASVRSGDGNCARAAGESGKQVSASVTASMMIRKPRSKRERPIDFVKGRVVIVFPFLFFWSD